MHATLDIHVPHNEFNLAQSDLVIYLQFVLLGFGSLLLGIALERSELFPKALLLGSEFCIVLRNKVALLMVIADVGASGLPVGKAWIINTVFGLMINLVSATQSVHADPLGFGHSLGLPRRLLRAAVDGD